MAGFKGNMWFIPRDGVTDPEQNMCHGPIPMGGMAGRKGNIWLVPVEGATGREKNMWYISLGGTAGAKEYVACPTGYHARP